MTASSLDPVTAADSPSRLTTVLWGRQLLHYPETGRRYWFLAISVATTIVLYYQLYVQYSMSTAILTHYGMTYTYFVFISVVANAVGAFGSLVAGLADRWGRANLTVYGSLGVGLLVTFWLPVASDKLMFGLVITLVSLVEGMILVTTPALVRDFSPQVGRASAMGFWTMGPVIGSLILNVVVSQTYKGATTWQQEVRFAGVAGLVVFVAALFGLRELSPRLRDQIMVSLRDRVLIEARAKGLQAESLLDNQWRQMLRFNVVGSAFAISAFLLFYYAAVGSFTVYYATVFGYLLQRTAGLLNWYWSTNALALILAGVASDRLRVRKPFMLVGALGSAVFVVLFALDATKPATGYYTFAWLCVGIGISGGLAFGPWMASFTETVERRNPAATATGLAVFGWINRILVAASVAVLPIVVSSVTPLVEHGAQVTVASQQAAPALAVINAHPQLFAQLENYPVFTSAPPALQAQAVQEVGAAGLTTVATAEPALKVLQQYGTSVSQASKDNPRDWRNWWWVCLAGQLLFIPFVFGMAGRWSPRRAKDDFDEYERIVAEQTAALG
ncbi:MAG TPA: MFS transporter [Actinocrinis sp.]|nr:MFS transporter [Actinocrinis sp.]